jgi:hypothetical protein
VAEPYKDYRDLPDAVVRENYAYPWWLQACTCGVINIIGLIAVLAMAGAGVWRLAHR